MKVAGQGSGLNLAKEVISARGERERFGSDIVEGLRGSRLSRRRWSKSTAVDQTSDAGVVFIRHRIMPRSAGVPGL